MSTFDTNGQAMDWITVCSGADVPEQTGVAALLPGARQAAVFRFNGDFYALSNIDPLSHAAVLARGIVGDVGGAPAVTSPLHKHRFDLRTGQCLDSEGVSVPTYPTVVSGGTVYLGLTAR